MGFDRFNAYRVMWVFCLFDLPTNTKTQRKRAADFRKRLVEDGFDMMQYSVYKRCCGSKESCDVHIKRIRHWVPEDGLVSLLTFTDKQFGDIETYVGKKPQKSEKAPEQLMFF